jgi:hypothetical protein
VCRSEAPEVALAAEAGPLGEDGQGDDLGVGEQGWTAGLAGGGGFLCFSATRSAAAIRGAIAGPVRTSDEPKPPTNFVFSAFCEVGLPLYGVL